MDFRRVNDDMVDNGRTAATCWFAIVGAVLAAGCGAGTGTAEDNGLLGDEGRQEIALDVKNLNFYDAELYALMGTTRVRLGFVNGNSSKRFSFRWSPQADLRIEIHLLAVGTYFSDRLPVEEGDELELIIEPDLHRHTPTRRR